MARSFTDLYSSSKIIRVIKSRRMRWVGACSTYGGEERRIQGLGGKPEGKRPLGRSRRRLEDNIKMELQEVRWGMEWIDLGQGRDRWRALVNAVMKLRVP